jgi:DNA-directed RNA polymerase specialized sigma24 family protein
MAKERPNPFLSFVRALSSGVTCETASDGELLERYRTRGDEAAFASLVVRHGGMVMHLCRRTLSTAEDAEDAFQATFLALARKARSMRAEPSVTGWLFTVGYRAAQKARVVAARRLPCGPFVAALPVVRDGA